jgi:hypothetical protein
MLVEEVSQPALPLREGISIKVTGRLQHWQHSEPYARHELHLQHMCILTLLCMLTFAPICHFADAAARLSAGDSTFLQQAHVTRLAMSLLDANCTRIYRAIRRITVLPAMCCNLRSVVAMAQAVSKSQRSRLRLLCPIDTTAGHTTAQSAHPALCCARHILKASGVQFSLAALQCQCAPCSGWRPALACPHMLTWGLSPVLCQASWLPPGQKPASKCIQSR